MVRLSQAVFFYYECNAMKKTLRSTNSFELQTATKRENISGPRSPFLSWTIIKRHNRLKRCLFSRIVVLLGMNYLLRSVQLNSCYLSLVSATCAQSWTVAQLGIPFLSLEVGAFHSFSPTMFPSEASFVGTLSFQHLQANPWLLHSQLQFICSANSVIFFLCLDNIVVCRMKLFISPLTVAAPSSRTQKAIPCKEFKIHRK